jgi:hypothetical protein
MLDGEVGLFPIEIRRHDHFLQPRLTAFPAEALQVLAGRGQRVRRAPDEIAAAVAVEIDRVLDIVRGQELHLAKLAGPWPAHLGGREIAALDDAQRFQELAAEQLRPPAIPGERGKGAQRAVLAGVGAEIGFKSPERNDGIGGDTELAFDALEDRRILLHQRRTMLHAVDRHHAVGELQERLAEDALAAILRDGRRIEAQAVEGGRDRGGRDALPCRVALELSRKAGKPAALPQLAAEACVAAARTKIEAAKNRRSLGEGGLFGIMR